MARGCCGPRRSPSTGDADTEGRAGPGKGLPRGDVEPQGTSWDLNAHPQTVEQAYMPVGNAEALPWALGAGRGSGKKDKVLRASEPEPLVPVPGSAHQGQPDSGKTTNSFTGRASRSGTCGARKSWHSVWPIETCPATSVTQQCALDSRGRHAAVPGSGGTMACPRGHGSWQREHSEK